MGGGEIKGELLPADYSEENLLALSMTGGTLSSNNGSAQ
jgi:ribose transport system ATP-binding protein